MTAPVLDPAFPLEQLQANPDNPRAIDADGRRQLSSSIARHGYVGVLVARRLADGTTRLIAGHQSLEQLRATDRTTAPCWIVDCTDHDERRLAITLNGHAGTWHDERLAAWWQELSAEDTAGLDDLAKTLGAQAAAVFRALDNTPIDGATDPDELPPPHSFATFRARRDLAARRAPPGRRRQHQRRALEVPYGP